MQAPAWEQWEKVWRIMLMTYVTMMLITDEHRIKMLIFVIALSLGFYGFKGGVFVLTGGSAHNVMGPAGSFIGDRNSIGLALIMTVPLLNFMQLQMTRWYVRYALLGGIGLTLVAIVGTHSRGALVGIVAMLISFTCSSRARSFRPCLSIIPLVVVMYYVMPEEWFERMQTIETWEEDKSASERVRAWRNAIELANERFIGGGMRGSGLVSADVTPTVSTSACWESTAGWAWACSCCCCSSPGARGAGSSATPGSVKICFGRGIWQRWCR